MARRAKSSKTFKRSSGDGRSLYVNRRGDLPIRVSRLDLVTGRKELWKEVMPAERAGIDWSLHLLLTPNGKWYVYDVRRNLTDLYLVEGLK